MNTLLLIPDGIGVRNFVLGSFLTELRRHSRATVLHDLPAGLAERPEIRGASPADVEWRLLPAYREDLVAFELRQALAYSHLYWGNTFGMQCMLVANRPTGSLKNRAARRAAMIAGRLAASRVGIELLDRQHEARVLHSDAARQAARVLEELQPDIVFCTHQRPVVVTPFVAAARAAGIPTATFIFSWDNLPCKGRIATRFDHFLVWSDLMRAEVRRFYPDVDEERIHVVGTPQFEPYTDPSLLWSREDYCRRVSALTTAPLVPSKRAENSGADPARPIICYSGCDADTCPDDPTYVEIIAGMVERGELEGNPQLLLRPAPVDNAHRYRAMLERHPSVILSMPQWHHPEGERWNWVVPSPADTQLLVNTVHHCAVNVNHASTMTLDFALLDRPVANVAFDVLDPPRWGRPLREHFYRFEHYLPVVELGAARISLSPGDLRDHLNSYLRDPSLDRAERRRLVEREVSMPLDNSSRRVVETLRRIAGRLNDADLCSS
jgi:hypothetical protein